MVLLLLLKASNTRPTSSTTGAVLNQNASAAGRLPAAAQRLAVLPGGVRLYLLRRSPPRHARHGRTARRRSAGRESTCRWTAGPADVAEVVRDIHAAAQPEVVFSTGAGAIRRSCCTASTPKRGMPTRAACAHRQLVHGGRGNPPGRLAAVRAGHAITAATYFTCWTTKATATSPSFGITPLRRPPHQHLVGVRLQPGPSVRARALERTGSLDPARLVRTAHSVHYDSPEGLLAIDSENNHCSLTPRIGVPRGRSVRRCSAGGAGQADLYLSTFGWRNSWLK